jgi:uncharacterized delta-60 repeat protein
MVATIGLAVAATATGCGDGKLDPTFDGDGRVTLDVGSGYIEEPADLAIDREGRIVIIGWLSKPGVSSLDGFVVRLLPDGTPDPQFNGGAAEIVDVAGSVNTLRSVVIDADGRILVAGATGVARLLPDGNLDRAFSDDGKATLDYGTGMSADAVVLDHQGRIVLGGSSSVPTAPQSTKFAVARLLADGSPDPAFAGSGVANPPVPWDGAEASAVAVDGNGRIVLAGTVTNFFTTSTWEALRLLPGGLLDESFGDGGLVELPSTGRGDALYDMALDPRGRIVLAGRLFPGGGAPERIGIARLLPSGDLDPGFGQGGRVGASGFGDLERAEAIAIDTAGRIVAAGQSIPGSAHGSALLARFTGSGAIDRTFGVGGFIQLDYRSPANYDDATALGIDDRGRYVIAGHSYSGLFDGLNDRMGAARFTIEYPARGSAGP